ncbi:MAG TPA: PTS sugar transporter subunit IIB, partial [Myxococcaceae bacterium]|nr:PTS sugar transporter subunit IIB [Myxococcaceae bacterium]
MISFVRIDNRLIHGQVVEAWLPSLKVGRVVV